VSTPTIIIDSDPIIYGAGFASQESTYEYILEKDGQLHQETFSDGNVARTFIKDNGYEVVDRTVHIEAKPEGFARQCAKTQIDSIIRRCCDELGVTDADVEMYLSGPGNYRYQLATISPYKGDRPPPPVHYQVLRDYLTERWNAVVVSGMEADDKVSIRCRELAADGTRFILATIDKDLDQVPGLHYGYKDKVFYDVSQEEGELVFWRQCISGDATDNIPGCYKIGAAKAEKLLALWQGQHEELPVPPSWPLYVWGRIVDTFAETLTKYPDRYPKGMTPDAAALETARLVWMQVYEGALWDSPGVPYGEVSSLAIVR